MATHSSILAWRIPWTEEPGGLQPMGSQRVGHDWVTDTFTITLVVEWFVQILIALQYLHEKYFLHWALQAQNVFLTKAKHHQRGWIRDFLSAWEPLWRGWNTYWHIHEPWIVLKQTLKLEVWYLGYEMLCLWNGNPGSMLSMQRTWILWFIGLLKELPLMLKDYSPELIELIRTMLNKKPEERPSVRSIPETALHKAPNIFVFGAHKAPQKTKITLKMVTLNSSL